MYQSAVGSLLYLSVATRPDIAYAVSNVAQFSANPTTQHWTAVKRIMRYLRGTINLGLVFTPQGKCDCVGFSDADWAGDLYGRKSTSGYVFQIGGSAVSWRSKKQTSCCSLNSRSRVCGVGLCNSRSCMAATTHYRANACGTCPHLL